MRKEIFLTLVVVMASCATAVLGHDPGEGCTAINDDLARQVCYDRALGHSPTTNVADPAPTEHWTVKSKKSMSNLNFWAGNKYSDVSFETVAEGSLQCSDDKPTLTVSCHTPHSGSGGFSKVVITHGCDVPVFKGSRKVEVELQVDDDPTIRTRLSTKSDGAFGWSDDTAKSTIRNLFLDHDNLLVRFSSSPESPQVAHFNIAGLRDVMIDALKTIEPICNWDYLNITPTVHWGVESTTSEFTDQTDVYISTKAEEALPCGDYVPELWIRCLEGDTDMFIAHGCYTPGDPETDQIEVDLRVDEEPAFRERLNPSTNGNAFGWWGYNAAISTIYDMFLDHDTLRLRFSPSPESPQIVRFNISDLRYVMKTTSPSCDWGNLVRRE